LSRFVSLCIFSLVALVLAGCGSQAGATAPAKVAAKATTATPAPVAADTPTSEPAVVPTVTSVHTRAATPTPPPTSTPQAAATASPTPIAPTDTPLPVTQPPKLVLVSVNPLTVPVGGTLHLLVHTAGGVDRAELYLGSGAPNAPSPSTFPLAEGSAGVWTGTGTAPSVGGTYHFTVGLYSAAGRRFLEDNDGWNLTVQGGNGATGAAGTGSGVKPLFADIPLAPPFSYGNPVAAVFNADGRTVNGSEVVSNTRTDVAASTVAQFYSVHFPRSGWSTTGATVPAGATSFSMSATSGSRVCIVQFSAGTVHIFYG
jgi:hypothetical protein